MYDKDILNKIIMESNCRTIDDTGLLYPPSHAVYRVISQRMKERGSEISPKHIYTILNCNRNGFQSIVRAKWNTPKHSASVEKLNESTSSINTSGESYLAHSVTPYSVKIKVVVSCEKYKIIKPEKKCYSNRVYWKFRPGWSDIIADSIWQQHNISCVFSFKNNIIRPSATAHAFALFSGKCVECQAAIRGRLKKEPENNLDVIIDCYINDIVSQLHTGQKKRHLRGERREIIATRLIKERKAAATFRYEEAKHLKQFGGKNPPTLPSKEVLRKAKEQQLLKQYGLSFGNPALNLLQHSKSSKFANTIHKIGLEKFFCMYWTPEQQQIYTARCKANDDAIFIIDATGSIATVDTKHDSAIFLYQCMIVTHEGSVPVFQMISADQTAVAIGHFLWTILAKGAPPPPIVVTDFGWALLIAVAKIFGACIDLRDYLQKCYDVAMLGKKTIPNTYIRLDVSHIIHMVTRWKCLGGKGRAVRNFYERCVAQAYQMADIEVITYFLESILVVALSEFIGSTNEGESVPSEKRLQHINNVIRDATVNDEEDTEKNEDKDNNGYDPDEATSSNTDWKGWTNNLNQTAMRLVAESQAGTTINGCYNPEFANHLKKTLIPYVPLWTGLIIPHFNRGPKIATSSAVESEFADIKKRSLKGILPTRPDKFVLQHIELHLEGKVRLASKEADLGTSQENNSCRTIKTDFQELESHLSLTHGDSIQKNDKKCTDPLDEQTYFEECEHLERSRQDIDRSVHLIDDNSSFETPSQWNINENWRGKAKKALTEPFSKNLSVKRRFKPTCLDKCSEWDYMQNGMNTRIPILQNGGKVILDKVNLNLQRTCAFDSIVQLFLSAIATNRRFREEVSEISIPVLNFIFSMLDNVKLTSKHYKERAKILVSLNLFKNSITVFTGSIKRLNAECNVAHLAEYLFAELPSITYNISCDCGYKNKHSSVTISVNVDILLKTGLGLIQEAIDTNLIKSRACRKCKIARKEEIIYGPYIMIDLSVASDERYETSKEQTQFILSTISSKIVLGNKEYVFAGLVHFIPGHYIAYAKSGSFWYKYDDLHTRRDNVKGTEKVLPHLILYVVSDIQKNIQ